MQKTPLSIRVIYLIPRLFYFLTILSCLAGMFFSFSLFTGFLAEEMKISLGLPIKSDSEEVGKAIFYGQEMVVTFADAKGKVNFANAPKIVSRILSLLVMVVIAIIFYLAHLFFHFVENVKKGVVFEIENLRILRKLGVTLLVLYFYLLITTPIWKHGFSFGQVDSGFSLHFSGGNVTILLSGLFLLMLSQIFLRGLELQEENKLTI